MQYRQVEGAVEISGLSDFEPFKIFECGQCFRWNDGGSGVYTGVAMGCAAQVYKNGENVYISGSLSDFERIWRAYFDLDSNYQTLRESVAIDIFMASAAEYGSGIRILRQDRWEALCSFIVSQCNNIPRIKGIIEAFCTLFGDEINFNGRSFYTFPTPERIATLEPEALSPIRCGYRAAYIIDAARKVADGSIDLEALSKAEYGEALAALKTIKGVGNKVANCVILFGLQIPDAFPIDVWIKKILSSHYTRDFDPSVFGKAAGLAQQYMFFYARQNGYSG